MINSSNSKSNLLPDTQLRMAVRHYWNTHIHDADITAHPVGTSEFFQDLDKYRFEKLDYLPSLVDFQAFNGQRFLEVGCGAAIDLIHFVRGGAIAHGVDQSSTALQLARQNLQGNGLSADLSLISPRARTTA